MVLEENHKKKFKTKVHEVIFEADTFYGKLFDILLLFSIILSILLVILESVDSINIKYGNALIKIEWAFTILFTAEYIARIYSIKKPKKYIFSFYGIIDFLSFIPTYILAFFTESMAINNFIVIRTIRLLRVFRILKLARYIDSSDILIKSINESKGKIIVFLSAMGTIVIIIGTLMYVIEGGENGFDSIPKGIYWAIVTLTTVGYGDIAPQTPIGQFLSSIIMIIGYGIIAVPTGIFAAGFAKKSSPKEYNIQPCPNCWFNKHNKDASFCKRCGHEIKQVELAKKYNTQSCPSCSFDNHENDATFCKKCGSKINL